MHTRVLLAAFIAVLLPCAAYAQSFDVQIGAFRNASVSELEVPAAVGSLRTVQGADGLTRFVVGPYATRAEAEQARETLRAAGYSGAFIRSERNSSDNWRERPATYSSDEIGEGHSDADADSSYATDGDGEVVYLDGKLHRKVGTRFIPLNN